MITSSDLSTAAVVHPAGRALRTGLTGLAATLCLCFAGPGTAAPPAKPSPSLVSKAHSAEQTMDQLAQLRQQAHSTRAAADRLSQLGRDTLAAWDGYRLADQQGRDALQTTGNCLPVLQQRLAASNAAMASLAQAVAQSQAAVRGVAAAEGDGLALAARDSDAAFQQRLAAETAFADRHRAASLQDEVCENGKRTAQGAIQTTRDRVQAVVDLARALAPQRDALSVRWRASVGAFDAAAQAGLLAPTGVALAVASDQQLKRLQQALADTGLPERGAAQAAVVVGPVAPSRVHLVRLTTELERLQDAAAYIDLSTAPPSGDCEHAHCAGLLAERRTLTLRMADAQARLRQAVDQWQQSPFALGESLTTLKTTLQSLNDRVQPMASTLEPAVTEATAVGRDVAAAATRLQSAADQAHRRARLAWERAYRLAYGTSPEPDGSVAAAMGFGMSQGAQGPSAAMMAATVFSHAYELFSSFDGEIADFGAYTYVLVRSASDLETPAVRQRFLQLLRILQTQPSARLVASADKPHVNVFCIPVAPGTEGARDASEVAYASDLGQQIKMRAQNGLLTQKAVRQRLTGSPGPFLITVPGRLARVQSGSPVLLADLSDYPPDAIADLTNHYMNGLVDDFPRQQALWQPPVIQRVALFMIHLAEGTGQLVTGAVPTAQAQPR